jgi:1-acyl-sn-glycerol-3-phosphate acyltransferase
VPWTCGVRERAAQLYRVGVTLLGWAHFVLACAVWALLLIPPTLLLKRAWPGIVEHFGSLTRGFLRFYVGSLLFLRVRVEGRETRLTGPRVLVVNHQSWLDPVVMIALEPRVAGPAKSSMFRVPVVGAVLRIGGFYDFDIGNISALERMQRGAAAALERGGALLFFAEGSRSRTGEVGPFRTGAFRTAVDHDLPIQPVVIEGMDRVLPPGHLIAQTTGRYPVRVRYLPPLRPPYGSGVRREVVRALRDRVRALIVDELACMRAERAASGDPRIAASDGQGRSAEGLGH